MKQGWEYKKLGEVCKFQQGMQVPIEEQHSCQKDGDMQFLRIIDFTQGNEPPRFISNYDMKCYISKEDIAIVRYGTPGYVCINKEGIIANNLFRIIPNDNFDLSKQFLAVWLKSPAFQRTIISQQYGVALKAIKFGTISNIPFPLPPLTQQQSIVAELDKINEIIALKKAQLKDLDLLAQSIFYDMFGDPIENPKGWEVKKLEDVSTIIAGGDKPKDISESPNGDYIYPVIANGEGAKGVLGYSNRYRISIPSVTIGARGASIGNCRIVEEKFTPVVRLITISPKECLDITYLYFYAKGIRYKSNGAGQAQLTVPNIKDENIPLPPLSLQQSFASKIQAIESQKSAIKQSLAEVETLLASRMDYYFN